MTFFSKKIRSTTWLGLMRKESPYFEPLYDEREGYIVVLAEEHDDRTVFPDREDLVHQEVSGATLDERVHKDLDRVACDLAGTIFGHDLLLACGQEVASAALFPELLAAVLRAFELAWYGNVYVYLPSCDLLCVSPSPIAGEMLPKLDAAASAMAAETGLAQGKDRQIGVALTLDLEGVDGRGAFTVSDLRTHDG